MEINVTGPAKQKWNALASCRPGFSVFSHFLLLCCKQPVIWSNDVTFVTLLSFIFRLLISCEQRKTKERTVCVCVCVSEPGPIFLQTGPRQNTKLGSGQRTANETPLLWLLSLRWWWDLMIIIRLKVGPFSFEKCTADKHLLLLFDGKEILGKKKRFGFFFKKKKKWKSPTVQSESELRLRVRPLVNFFSPRRSDNLTGRKRKLLNENI